MTTRNGLILQPHFVIQGASSQTSEATAQSNIRDLLATAPQLSRSMLARCLRAKVIGASATCGGRDGLATRDRDHIADTPLLQPVPGSCNHRRAGPVAVTDDQ